MGKIDANFLPKNNHSLKHWLSPVVGVVIAIGLLAGQLPARQAAAEPEVDPESSIFGVQTHEYSTQGGAMQILSTDTAWVRGFELVWSDLEPGDPSDHWELPTTLVEQVLTARGDGLEPILTVRSTPEWAWKHVGWYCGPMVADKFTDFADFIIEALGKFPAEAPITYLELWNEPDVSWEDVPGNRIWGGCWGEKADSEYYGGDYYAEMLKVVSPAVKNAFPEVQILIGGLQMECDPGLPLETCVPPSDPDPRPWKHNSTKFFDGILAGGGGPYFDGVSFHAYDYDNPDNPRGQYANTSWNTAWNSTGPVLAAKVRYLRNALQKYGVSGKYLMSTENSLLSSNWAVNPDNSTFEQTKAGYLVKSYAIALTLDLKANLWFEMVGRWDRGGGLLSPGLVAYPAYEAYQFASQKLYAAEALGELNRSPLITGYEFRTTSGLLWIIWSADGADHVVDLGVDFTRVLNIKGGLAPEQENPLTVTYEPLYVELPDVINRLYVPSAPQGFYPFQNGGFEAGLGGWKWTNGGLPASLVSGAVQNPVTGGNDPVIPAGANTARLGSPTYNCSLAGVPFPAYAAVEQTLTLPDATRIELQFDYIIYTEDGMPVSGGSSYDRFEVFVSASGSPQLLFSDGNTVNANLGCGHWRRVPGPENVRGGAATGWATGTIDLSAFRDQNVTVSFQNHSRFDGYYNTYTYLDNVRLVTVP